MTRTRNDLISAARAELGRPGTINTCMIAVARWLRAAGFPLRGEHSDGNGRADANVSDFHDLARRGIDGYTLIPVRDAQPGDILIWPNDSHITVLSDVLAGDRLRSIGSGGPSGKVAYQPTNGGGNPRGYFPAAVRAPIDHPSPAPAVVGGSGDLAQSSTENDGEPGPVMWTLFQRWAQDHGYTGPLDGDPGQKTWEAVQKALRDYGYEGPIDGDPGKYTYAALQRWARQGGYEGPDDGDPGKYTWKAVAAVLNRTYAR